MPYDRPTGRELQLLKVYKKLEEASCETHMNLNVSITYGHALDGVRVNEYQHLISLSTYRYEWKIELATAKHELQTWITNYRNVKKIHAEMEKEIKMYFRVCQGCHGKGGCTKPPDHSWEDCSQCWGRGLIEK